MDQDQETRAKLFAAVTNRSGRKVQALLKSGAEPNASNSEGETALMKSVVNEVDIVIEQDSNNNWEETREVTAPDIQIVRQLLDAGADVSLQNGDGKTAIDLATAEGHDDLAELLHAFSNRPGDDPRPDSVLSRILSLFRRA
jgi:hypothetical protein